MNFKIFKSDNIANDFWGGLAAMLVALPSAIAFGVTVYAALGAEFVSYGALSGILGVIALGVIAPIFGGTNLLISAPCAPAAAVLTGFVTERISTGHSADSVLLMVTLIALFAGIIQIGFGSVRLGTLIKFMPYPVVSGYLSGVGLYIIVSQTPKFLGAPKNVHFWESLLNIDLWKWQSITIGFVTIFAMVIAPKITKTVPAVIISLLSGIVAYFALSLIDPSLLNKASNPLIVGSFSSGGGGMGDSLSKKVLAFGNLNFSDLSFILVPSLTLAVLLSIDTLKTCVVLDALTHSRHESNRELIGQGIGNVFASFMGGVPGAGTMGATLVNISSGASSRISGVIEGCLAIVAYLLLGNLIAWVPIASLAGILCVIGVKMIDKQSFHFLKSRSTIPDFVIIVSVIITALSVSLIMASGVGILFAIVLFIQGQINATILYRKSYGNVISSRKVRVEKEVEILKKNGDSLAVYELQGSLFFGTANQLYSVIDEDLKTKKYIIIDMKRVQSVDITAVHILEQIEEILDSRKGYLIFSRVPKMLPTGQDVQSYLGEVGIVKKESKVMIFDDIDDAIEWVEEKIFKTSFEMEADTRPLELEEFELFKGRKEKTISDLAANMQTCSYKAGEKIFSAFAIGDEIYFIRRGSVKIILPLANQQRLHLSTFGKGNFFGEMSFLDGVSRSAEAVSDSDTELFVLSREAFDNFAQEHKESGIIFLSGLASVLAGRLRLTNSELRALSS